MRRPTQPLTCYMCDERATGSEHAPPKCFFPKGRLRQNPITVPSCDTHNSQKSANDEYLRHIFVNGPNTNTAAAKIFSGPVKRSFERRPRMFDTFYKNLRELPNSAGNWAASRVDLERFNNGVGSIVRALHFHCFESKLLGKIVVVWEALRLSNLTESEVSPFIRRAGNFYLRPFIAVLSRTFSSFTLIV